ncbi:MAG: dockerin type I repeat-containing protein, partial [Clostridia bacterium]|nr:dockerin type I repeat-containing protein [Clostridia bacterium]
DPYEFYSYTKGLDADPYGILGCDPEAVELMRDYPALCTAANLKPEMKWAQASLTVGKYDGEKPLFANRDGRLVKYTFSYDGSLNAAGNVLPVYLLPRCTGEIEYNMVDPELYPYVNYRLYGSIVTAGDCAHQIYRLVETKPASDVALGKLLYICSACGASANVYYYDGDYTEPVPVVTDYSEACDLTYHYWYGDIDEATSEQVHAFLTAWFGSGRKVKMFKNYGLREFKIWFNDPANVSWGYTDINGNNLDINFGKDSKYFYFEMINEDLLEKIDSMSFCDTIRYYAKLYTYLTEKCDCTVRFERLFIFGSTAYEGYEYDMNYDGLVTLKDLSTMKACLAGRYNDIYNIAASDQNGDGLFTISDLSMLKSHIAG